MDCGPLIWPHISAISVYDVCMPAVEWDYNFVQDGSNLESSERYQALKMVCLRRDKRDYTD